MREEELARLISDAARRSFVETQNAIGRDEIIGYALTSHDTADSCGPVVATRSGLEAFTPYGSAEEFRYSPDNWDCFDNQSAFDRVNQELLRLYETGDYEEDPEWHNRFRQLVFCSSVAALEALVGEGFFGIPDERDALFVMFGISGSLEWERRAPEWASRLNTPSVTKRFLQWHRATFNAGQVWDDKNFFNAKRKPVTRFWQCRGRLALYFPADS